jgi:hypothetical protein
MRDSADASLHVHGPQPCLVMNGLRVDSIHEPRRLQHNIAWKRSFHDTIIGTTTRGLVDRLVQRRAPPYETGPGDWARKSGRRVGSKVECGGEEQTSDQV